LSVVVRYQPSDHGPQTDKSGPSVNLRPGDKTAALPASELIDVAVWRAKVAPTAAALVHLPAEKLHTGRVQLPHGAGEIVDDEADDGTGGKVLVVLVGWAEHLEGAPLRELKAAKSDPSWLVISPRTPWRKATMAAYSLVLVPAHPMRLTRILASPLLRCLAPRDPATSALSLGLRVAFLRRPPARDVGEWS
jgi:hypothetical protein